MYLIIGLGNPGKEYEYTRHNAGRIAVNAFRKLKEFPEFLENSKMRALVSQKKLGKEKILLALPETMMNSSGKSVSALVQFYKIKSEHVLVIHDDADILFGRAKISFAKSSAGHRGVESVRRALKTEKFWRIRIGIQPSAKKHVPATELVLRKFKPTEESLLKKTVKRVLEGLELFVTENPNAAMNALN